MGFIATDWQEGENNHRGYKFISATKFYNVYCKLAKDNDKHVSCASASDLSIFLLRAMQMLKACGDMVS